MNGTTKESAKDSTKDLKIRAILGTLPILFALYTTVFYVWKGQASETLWVCNVMNYTLGLGILFRIPSLTWISTLWLLAGSPLWVWDVFVRGVFFTPQAFCVHIVSSGIGLAAIRREPRPRAVWWQAVLVLAGLQLLARWVTDPVYNVNLAHDIYPPFKEMYSSYWSYWFSSLLSFCVSLGAMEWALARFWARSAEKASRSAW